MGRRRIKPSVLAINTLMWGIVGTFMLPFYTLFAYAFKERSATMTDNPLAFPTTLYLKNFTDAIEKAKLPMAFRNSAVSTVSGVVVLVIVCSMAAYIIARRSRSRFYATWQYIFLAAIMLPFQTVMFPIYKNLASLNWLNTISAYVLVMVGFHLPYNIFLYIGFIKTVPIEMEEAAMIDGCGRYRTFFRVVFPLLRPINMTVIVLSALAIWNDFQIALVVVMKSTVRTVTLAQQQFITAQISYLNLAAAACILSTLPMFVLFLFLQKYIAKGIMAGAVKG